MVLAQDKILGHQIIATFKCTDDIINDYNTIKRIFDEAVKTLTVLSNAMYRFPNSNGVTGFYLIAESHVAYHTWPEYNTITIDIFTCSTKEVTEQVFNYLLEHLKPITYTMQYNVRTTL